MPRTLRSTLIALALGLAVALGAIAPAGLAPAAAHDYLIDASPAEGEELAEAPSEARLEFSGDILEIGTELALVRDGTGELVEFPAPFALSNGRVTQPLPPLEPGRYTLNWRVVSEDGHPIAGAIPFGVADEDGAVPAAPTVSAGDRSEPAPGSGATEAPGLPPALTIAIVGIAALAAAAGGVLMVMRLKRGGPGLRWDQHPDPESDDPREPQL